jgi:hypothetical protein
VVISCQRFGTTHRSHLQRSVKMGPIGCPETSVRNYNYSLRNNPEERSSHLLRGESLKSHTFEDYLKLISTVDRKLARRAEVKNKLSCTITLPHSLIHGWTGTTLSHATRRNNVILTNGNFPVTNSHGICEHSSLKYRVSNEHLRFRYFVVQNPSKIPLEN